MLKYDIDEKKLRMKEKMVENEGWDEEIGMVIEIENVESERNERFNERIIKKKWKKEVIKEEIWS